MKDQKELIWHGGWDHLIVLDACRYDYFKRVYKNYLNGKLQKVRGSICTSRWLKETWKGWFGDIVYISASPYVNSYKGRKVLLDFDPCEHFFKIIDVWDWGWDDKLKTIPPHRVCKATRIAKIRYPKKRLVAHFIQPHTPYLALGGPIRKAYGLEKVVARGRYGREKVIKKKSLAEKTRRFYGELIGILLGKARAQRISLALNIKELFETEAVVKKYGKDVLHRVYMENVKAVLKEVGKLVKRLPGKSVVTADHGELLGEDGLYDHECWYTTPILREVPWLEVE